MQPMSHYSAHACIGAQVALNGYSTVETTPLWRNRPKHEIAQKTRPQGDR